MYGCIISYEVLGLRSIKPRASRTQYPGFFCRSAHPFMFQGFISRCYRMICPNNIGGFKPSIDQKGKRCILKNIKFHVVSLKI